MELKKMAMMDTPTQNLEKHVIILAFQFLKK
jgi:hypothetical protein